MPPSFLRRLFERRCNTRVEFRSEVKVRMMGREIAVAECSNIGTGGMCLIFDAPPVDAGTGTVWFSRKFPEGLMNFEASFRKAWIKPLNPGSESTIMGIVFQELSPVQRDNIKNIMNRIKNVSK